MTRPGCDIASDSARLAHLARYTSSGLEKVAVIVCTPGSPGRNRSDSGTWQDTVAETWAGVPGARPKPLSVPPVSTSDALGHAVQPVRLQGLPRAGEPGLLGRLRIQRQRRLPGGVPRRRVHRRLRDRRPAGRDDEGQQHEQHGREHDELERRAALVRGRMRAPPPPGHGRNSSTGACTVSETRTVRPGTKLGTRPDTVTATVVALLCRTVAGRVHQVARAGLAGEAQRGRLAGGQRRAHDRARRPRPAARRPAPRPWPGTRTRPGSPTSGTGR